MDYNNFELQQLRKIKTKKYSELEPYEKFLLKDNVRMHRKAKYIKERELIIDNQTLDLFSKH